MLDKAVHAGIVQSIESLVSGRDCMGINVFSAKQGLDKPLREAKLSHLAVDHALRQRYLHICKRLLALSRNYIMSDRVS